MKKKVLKFQIDINTSTVIKTDGTFTVCLVEYQKEKLFIWLEVCENNMPQTLKIKVYGTGEHIPGNLSHVRSILQNMQHFNW